MAESFNDLLVLILKFEANISDCHLILELVSVLHRGHAALQEHVLLLAGDQVIVVFHHLVLIRLIRQINIIKRIIEQCIRLLVRHRLIIITVDTFAIFFDVLIIEPLKALSSIDILRPLHLEIIGFLLLKAIALVVSDESCIYTLGFLPENVLSLLPLRRLVVHLVRTLYVNWHHLSVVLGAEHTRHI